MSQLTVKPVLVAVAPMRDRMTRWLTRGFPRQFCVMNEKRRCSILFHLLVPGGKWVTVISRPVSVGQFLKLPLPQTHPRAVAAAGICCDVEAFSCVITRLPKPLPPAADTLNGKGSGVAVYANVHPALIGGNIVNSIGGHLAQLLDFEIVHADRLRLPLAA